MRFSPTMGMTFSTSIPQRLILKETNYIDELYRRILVMLLRFRFLGSAIDDSNPVGISMLRHRATNFIHIALSYEMRTYCEILVKFVCFITMRYLEEVALKSQCT